MTNKPNIPSSEPPLLPCPFPHEVTRGPFLDIDEEYFFIVRGACGDCGACGPFVNIDDQDKASDADKAEAARLWNTRPSSPVSVVDKDVGRSPLRGSGHQPSASAAPLRSASSQSGVPNAGALLDRLRSKTRRRELETGTGYISQDGSFGFVSNGEVWQLRNPEGEEAAALIGRLTEALVAAKALIHDLERNCIATISGSLETQWQIDDALAASGIETRQGGDPVEGRRAKHESPTGEAGDAQPESQS